MRVDKNELLIIYNSDDLKDRETLGYAESLKHLAVKSYDVSKETPTEWQLEQLADKLGVDVKELINKHLDLYMNEYAGVDLDHKGVLKLLRKHPMLLKTPIAVFEDHADFVDSSYDFNKIDMKTSDIKDSEKEQLNK